MRLVSVILALIAFVAGMRSAWLWYGASRLQVVPMWGKDGRIEPLIRTLAHDEWILAQLETATRSSALNRKAAAWTAATVVLTTLSTLAGAVSCRS
ncbi:MAG TPA: hypothetical protein VGU01_11250 [Sphingomicrobium sp.]|nr:hypothetical protein [Sphingomicrobium sp.]